MRVCCLILVCLFCLLSFSFPIALCWSRKMDRLQRFCQHPRSFSVFYLGSCMMKLWACKAQGQSLKNLRYYDVHPKHIQSLFEGPVSDAETTSRLPVACTYSGWLVSGLSVNCFFPKHATHGDMRSKLDIFSLEFWLGWAGSITGARATEPWLKKETIFSKVSKLHGGGCSKTQSATWKMHNICSKARTHWSI